VAQSIDSSGLHMTVGHRVILKSKSQAYTHTHTQTHTHTHTKIMKKEWKTGWAAKKWDNIVISSKS